MALALTLESLVAATLPAGMGFVGFLGLDPGGGQCHVWAPVPLEIARAVSPPGGLPPELFGGRPGWRYRFCPTYAPPPPGPGGPDLEAVRAARLDRARATGHELAAWLRGQGLWVELP